VCGLSYNFKNWIVDPRKQLLDSYLFPKGEKPRYKITTKCIKQIFVHYAMIILPHLKKEISLDKPFNTKREAEMMLSVLAYHHLHCNSMLQHPDIKILVS